MYNTSMMVSAVFLSKQNKKNMRGSVVLRKRNTAAKSVPGVFPSHPSSPSLLEPSLTLRRLTCQDDFRLTPSGVSAGGRTAIRSFIPLCG